MLPHCKPQTIYDHPITTKPFATIYNNPDQVLLNNIHFTKIQSLWVQNADHTITLQITLFPKQIKYPLSSNLLVLYQMNLNLGTNSHPQHSKYS